MSWQVLARGGQWIAGSGTPAAATNLRITLDRGRSIDFRSRFHWIWNAHRFTDALTSSRRPEYRGSSSAARSSLAMAMSVSPRMSRP